MAYEVSNEAYQQDLIVEDYTRDHSKKGSLRILHIWNLAGIGGRLARYLDRYFNTESLSVHRKALDLFQLGTEKTEIWDTTALKWLIKAFLRAKDYDVLHFHSLDRYLWIFRKAYPKKKIIIHYHGTEIRGRWEYRRRYWKNTDIICVSTPDLLQGAPENAFWIPNTVDEELCDDLQMPQHMRNGKAFHVDRYAVDIAEKFVEKYGLEMDILVRDDKPLPHNEFLRKMAKYSCVIDVKRDNNRKKKLEAMSLTGLEALFMNIPVINWQGEWIESYPPYHESHWVANRLYKIYSDKQVDSVTDYN